MEDLSHSNWFDYTTEDLEDFQDLQDAREALDESKEQRTTSLTTLKRELGLLCLTKQNSIHGSVWSKLSTFTSTWSVTFARSCVNNLGSTRQIRPLWGCRP